MKTIDKVIKVWGKVSSILLAIFIVSTLLSLIEESSFGSLIIAMIAYTLLFFPLFYYSFKKE